MTINLVYLFSRCLSFCSIVLEVSGTLFFRDCLCQLKMCIIFDVVVVVVCCSASLCFRSFGQWARAAMSTDERSLTCSSVSS